ncbi:uncharacterized protein LOC120915727 [Rana temporaria]|uniref:uncharacterized protein LOC120915727 n=1 Tax=Rana temporaria TaxID=8407 RepID=UPI001AAE052B|nr:uncharacterized protein LOC120915727 [Rana temporaria]XP_040182416.1 uncharacterized protein LOC120915727 [Rana temporaria]XP_040182417.1 uncharacterized protein LOC120915727 [Rana temporaria]
MPSCIVKKCTSHWKRKERNVIFHVFPNDKERIKQWLMRTGQFDDSNIAATVEKVWLGKPNDSYRICSKHFAADMYQDVCGKMKLKKKEAYPSIFPTDGASADVEDDERRIKRLCTEQNRDTSLNVIDQTACDDSNANETLLFPSSMQTENTSVFSAGEAISEFSSIPETPHFDLTTSESYVQSRKRLTWSKGVMTDFSMHSKNKKIGTLPFFGCKNKKIQHCPETRDVGIQCDLSSSSKKRKKGLSRVKLINGTSPDEENDDLPISDVVQRETPIVFSQGPSVKSEMDDVDLSYNPANDSNIDNEQSDLGAPREDQFYSLEKSKLTSAVSGSGFAKERKFLVFESCLDNLLAMVHCKYGDCNASISKVKKKLCGSCLSVYAICKEGHRFLLWQSQPNIGNRPVGDVLIASSTLCSGSNFLTIESFLRLLGMTSISKTTYYEYQKNYLFPAIDYHWQLDQNNTISQLSGHAVCLSGDRQCDSPGSNAKYCTYSFVEAKTQKIVGFAVEQRTPSSSFIALEGKAFVKALDELQDRGLNVRIICTDRNVTIRKLLQEKYSNILHQFDVGRMAKSVGAKLRAASKKKRCSELAPWIPSIKKHLRWASANCERNALKLKEQWCSVLYHVINVHQWRGCEHYKECKHSSIREKSNITRKWLREGSCAYKELKDIILRKTWLRDIERLTLFCHTGNLEIFHSTALKYKPKSNHFFMDAMVARTQLSILEHNSNLQDTSLDQSNRDRTKSEGYSSTARGQWVLRVVYEARRQDFVYGIYNHIFSALRGQL